MSSTMLSTKAEQLHHGEVRCMVYYQGRGHPNVVEKRGWDRKEVVSVHPSTLLSGGVDVDLYGHGKDAGKHVHAWGRNEEEARETAYKRWREKYG